MITFFQPSENFIIAIGSREKLGPEALQKIHWLIPGATHLDVGTIEGTYIGPRKEMISPWSTNAVEICQNMGLRGITRMEEFRKDDETGSLDPMLQQRYSRLDQSIFTIDRTPEPVRSIEDIEGYNRQEGLALSAEEIDYLIKVSHQLGRPLTDSEVFGFSQVNSEHCRHKIFNGTFIIDGETKSETLFQLIKKTSKKNSNYLVSAYKDNVAFIQGPAIQQFSPTSPQTSSFFTVRPITSVLSLKAETHNFPTTVEPFNGAATGSGGEIRDRMAGGTGSIPLAGTAVYMTSYPRLDANRVWEGHGKERDWLYQSPAEILTKASNGASDYGNKFGQPLICGSLLTFEHSEGDQIYGYDKVIMLAGGIGYANARHATKKSPQKDNMVVVMGGDNYRIGMGGGAVSSVNTGEFEGAIELNAVQRSNPEMQKRVQNALRALAEDTENPVISIHDHGAGGHLNCLSELVEETGAIIYMDRLPVGDPTLSDREIIGNESQERMGLVIDKKHLPLLEEIAARERAPMYVVGEITGDHRLVFFDSSSDKHPFDLDLSVLFGSSPKTILEDQRQAAHFDELPDLDKDWVKWLDQVLQLESVASKDWLTNKVDRSVSGKVAMQQTAGPLQLPLHNVAIMTLDFGSYAGIATAIGQAPVPGLISAAGGARLSVTEALTNLLWAPLTHGLSGVSLSANWMWPAKNPGENARVYEAVEALSAYAIGLGINVPTGKDSMSMTQKYPDGTTVFAPGTVIVSAVAEVDDIRKAVGPVLRDEPDTELLYISPSDMQFALGGSSLAQVIGKLGTETPEPSDPEKFAIFFNTLQELVDKKLILAGHDISSGGMITTLLEMCFARPGIGMSLSMSDLFPGKTLTEVLYSEQPGVILQVRKDETAIKILEQANIDFYRLGEVIQEPSLSIDGHTLSIEEKRDRWMHTSYLMDQRQTHLPQAQARFEQYKKQPLHFTFPNRFSGRYADLDLDPFRTRTTGIQAAIIREKGINGDREMAFALHLAGFDVKDVHMTDLISGRETLDDIHFIVFTGGFSNSDVLGSAKGWAGAFLFNPKAKAALDRFYKREDTLSLGVCNGCQVITELKLIYPEAKEHPRMLLNECGKFESHFLTVDIEENQTVLFRNLAGTNLGIWVAHGEGRFQLKGDPAAYRICARYHYKEFPGNPNGSDHHAAAIASHDGRHVAIMPHLERSIFPWNWAYYPEHRKNDEISPWMMAFANAREWVKAHH